MKYEEICVMLHEEAEIAINAGVRNIDDFEAFLYETFKAIGYQRCYKGAIRSAWDVEYGRRTKEDRRKVELRAWGLRNAFHDLVFSQKKLTERDYDEIIEKFGFRRILKE